MMNNIKIFVYGSCHYCSPKPGAYAVVVTVNGERQFHKTEGFTNTTHARMDILGIIEGLSSITDEGEIVIYLANDNVIHTITKRWLENWKKKGFKKVKHQDLWLQVDQLLSRAKCEILFKNSREVWNDPNYAFVERLAKKTLHKLKLQGNVNPEGDRLIHSVSTEIKFI